MQRTKRFTLIELTMAVSLIAFVSFLLVGDFSFLKEIQKGNQFHQNLDEALTEARLMALEQKEVVHIRFYPNETVTVVESNNESKKRKFEGDMVFKESSLEDGNVLTFERDGSPRHVGELKFMNLESLKETTYKVMPATGRLILQ